jgi:GH18 family chitinase
MSTSNRGTLCTKPVRSVWEPVRPILAIVVPPEHIKHKQASIGHKTKKQQVIRNKSKTSASKIKAHIFYTCWSKGHESNDCPNDNIPTSKLVDYAFSRLRGDKNGIYATRVISSPQTIRAIWIPKSLVTNPKGPNMVWVPKRAF